MSKIIGIYSLSENGEVKYIGQSKNIHKRYSQHCSLAQNMGNTKRQKWIRGLLSKGMKPELSILEVTEDLDSDEVKWIERYDSLTNTAKGGQSMWHCRKAKSEKPWGNKFSPVQNILCRIKQTINILERLGKVEEANKMRDKLLLVLDKIESFGKDEMNMILWERKYG